MEEEDRIRYETLFYCQKLEGSFLSGDAARALFIRSKLPLPDLTKIWKLSDITQDNKLDVFEFSIAMHLIELKLWDQEIPKQLDSSVPSSNQTKDVIIPVMAKTEKNQLKNIFGEKDTNYQGYLERDVVQPLLLASGLSSSVLSKIWNIADLDRDGRLSFLEFAIALHLVKNCIKGISLSGPVNPFLCIPDEENAIALCKEKLKVFDKEFLLEQKKKEKENFSDCRELNDVDFDLLVDYLPDIVALNKGKRERSHQNTSRAQRQEPEFGSVEIFSKAKPSIEPTGNIECHRLAGKELKVDLEAIFQTVQRDHLNEVPKYIARPAQCDMTFSAVGGGMKDNEIDDIMPVLHKRTYIGKQLVFEDPIGSETIGDVEFEVDFESVIKDIEKYSVVEERRLPIARVLPIYKSLPVADEQPCEKKTAIKGINEIDLDSISDYNMNHEIFPEEKQRNNLDRDIIGSIKHAGAQEKQNVIIANNSKEVNGSKNLSHKENTNIDIVEQKRMMMQSQLEKRRKPRGIELNDQVIRSSSEIIKPYSVATKYYPKEVCERKEELRQGGNTHLEESRETTKCNVGSKTSNQEMNERNAEVEDEKSRHEAEERENLLLERIKFLESKRRKLLETQQELKSKNVEGKHYSSTSNQRMQEEHITCNGERTAVMPNHVKSLDNGSEKAKNTNITNTKSIDFWPKDSGQPKEGYDSVTNEEEKRHLTLALETKRKCEAELLKRREIELREAENRRLEQMAREKKEHEGAKERKRNFLENLEILKQRVVDEETMKQSSSKKDTGISDTCKQKFTSISSSHDANTQLSRGQHGILNNIDKTCNTSLNQAKKQSKSNFKKLTTDGEDKSSSATNYANNKNHDDLRSKEKQLEEDEIRRENFQSHRELFTKNVDTEKEANADNSQKRKARPKSYHGGMFNRSIHQIIDDDVLAHNESVNEENEPVDLVDKEALVQLRRDEQFRRERERMRKHRSLDRDTSYTVENVEKLWKIDANNVPRNDSNVSCDRSQKKGKESSDPRRRSLVNTLTTEWNSFLDILESDSRMESETVQRRQDISVQRKKSTQGREKHAEIKRRLAKEAKCDSSKEIVQYPVSSIKSEHHDGKIDLETLTRQSWKVMKMVNSYKRLSAPNLLQQDLLWSPCTQPEKPVKISVATNCCLFVKFLTNQLYLKN